MKARTEIYITEDGRWLIMAHYCEDGMLDWTLSYPSHLKGDRYSAPCRPNYHGNPITVAGRL